MATVQEIQSLDHPLVKEIHRAVSRGEILTRGKYAGALCIDSPHLLEEAIASGLEVCVRGIRDHRDPDSKLLCFSGLRLVARRVGTPAESSKQINFPLCTDIHVIESLVAIISRQVPGNRSYRAIE